MKKVTLNGLKQTMKMPRSNKLTKAQAREILSKILHAVDNDVWRSYFYPPAFEREESEIKDDVEKMLNIIREHNMKLDG